MNNKKGILIVLSGPSGSGKGTICSELTRYKKNLHISISATSRTPRFEDIEGKSYYFKTVQEFEDMIKNDELLEWVKYCDNYYGTPKKNIDSKLEQEIDVILEIEVNGALSVKKKYPDSVLIFIVPPRYEDLIKRLRGRGTENEEVIFKRIEKATIEIQSIEYYDYLVVNDTIENAVSQVLAIIDSEKKKVSRNKYEINKFVENLKEAKIND